MAEDNVSHPITHPSSDHDEPAHEANNIPPSQPTTTTTTTTTATIRLPVGPGRGRKSGAGTYHMAERIHFLNIMLEVLPIGPEQWAEVTSRHAETYAGREVESLRRKYTELHRKNIPSGDPNIPEDIRLAKRIKYDIGCKADIGGDEDSYDVSRNTFGRESQAAEMNFGSLPPQAVEASHANNSSPSSTSTYRSRSKVTKPVDFMQVYQMQILQEAKERREDRRLKSEERREDRRDRNDDRVAMLELVTTVVAGIGSSVASYFGNSSRPATVPTRKRNRSVDVESSSEGENDSGNESATLVHADENRRMRNDRRGPD